MSLHEPPIAPILNTLERRATATRGVEATRVRADGKFFRCGNEKWFAKGLTYGPFAPNAHGMFLPDRAQVCSDLNQIRDLGGTAIRVYHAPPTWFLDDVAGAGLRVLVDVPWQKHRCFLEDYSAQRDAFRCVREAAALGEHPAVFARTIKRSWTSGRSDVHDVPAITPRLLILRVHFRDEARSPAC
jgi:hypothetical protein